MKLPTASLSSIFTPDKRDNVLPSAEIAKEPFLQQANLSNRNEESQQRLQSPKTFEQTKVTKLNSTALTRIETAKIQRTRGQSLQHPKFTISRVETDANNTRVDDMTYGLRRPVASLQKLTPRSIRKAECEDVFHSFDPALNIESSCSPTTSDPVSQEASRLPSPVQRRQSLPVLTTPLRQAARLFRRSTTVKRLFPRSENVRGPKVEAPKSVERMGNHVFIEEETEDAESLKLQGLKDSVENLAKKLASISLREDNLKRESVFYKTVIFKIEDIIARSQDQSVLSTLTKKLLTVRVER